MVKQTRATPKGEPKVETPTVTTPQTQQKKVTSNVEFDFGFDFGKPKVELDPDPDPAVLKSSSVLFYVVDQLMGIVSDSPLDIFLEQNSIKTIYDLVSFNENDINNLTYYTDENYPENKIELPIFQKSLMRMITLFFNQKIIENNGILEEDDVLAITKAEWNFFRVMNLGNTPTQTSTGNNTRIYTPCTNNYNNNSELNNFIKGVKRDKTQYSEIKDDRHFDNWQRSFLAIVRSHRIQDVFDPTYIPTTAEEILLFEEKQNFAYTVLDATLKTDMGKALVRKYEGTYDAQKIWAEFIKDAKLSTKAQIVSSDILAYITSAKYDNTWKGTSTSFILYWINKVREYDTFVINVLERFNDNQKLAMLQNTVNDVPELRQVRINSEYDVAKGGQRLNYEQYSSLLLSASTAFDKLHDSHRGSNRKQHVYNTKIDDDNEISDTDKDDEDNYNMDTYLTNVTRRTPIQARKQKLHQTSSNTSNSTERNFIPRDDWNRIPKDVQAMLTAGKKNNADLNIHIIDSNNDDNHNNNNNVDLSINNSNSIINDTNNDNNNKLLAFMSNKSELSQDDIRQVLSTNLGISHKGNNSNNKTHSNNNNDEVLTINGTKYRKINVTNTYRINVKHFGFAGYSLIDRGANGGVLGADVRVIEHSTRTVCLTGLDNHQVNNLPICTAAGYGITQKGPVIFIMHQYAYIGQGKTIHSSAQLESYKLDVDDRSRKIPGGLQRIKTPDGYLIPLDIIQGLPYMKLRPPTDFELQSLPHIILTSDNEWDPSVLDNKIDDSTDTWYNEDDNIESFTHHPFDAIGTYKYREIAELNICHSNQFPVITYDYILDDMITRYVLNINMKNKEPNYSLLQPNFGWVPINIIKKTFQATTQFVRSLHLYNDMRKHFKSRFPAFNVMRRSESVATDTIFSDTPAIDDGSKCAQFFVGRDSLVCDIYGMKTDKEFVNTLQDNIRRRGAMDKLISDRAKSEISARVLDILRALMIKDWQSEPYHQHQNFAERRYGTIKSKTNVVLNRTGAPASTWLLCIQYVCILFNHLATESLDWRTPMQVLTGETSDISIFLMFYFWEEVYYTHVKATFPSSSTEEKGHFVGFGETVGDAMTFKILCDDSNKIIYRSNVRSANDNSKENKRLSNDEGSDIIYIKSKNDDLADTDDNSIKQLPFFKPMELIGKTYLGETQEDGQRFRMRIVKAIADHKANINKHPEMVKFLVQNKSKDLEQILTYQDIIEHIQNNEINDDTNINEQYLKFKNIIAHQGPLTQFDPAYKGSKYNVMVEWEDGECTYEPLSIIAEDDPISCATYGRVNGLLDSPGWKRFKRFTTQEINVNKIINNVKSYKTSQRSIKYKYGYKIPKSHEEAVQFDLENNNTNWQDAEALEIKLLHQYNTFEDAGTDKSIPAGYKRIICLWVYDVKHDGRHRARLVAGGHLTPITDESVYSGVVSLRGLRIVVFLSVLNDLILWGGDVGSAYLEALTKEKVCFIAGKEFKELCGHTLLIFKALYGLRTSGLRWHERFADILRNMGFFPSKAENDIWMRVQNNIYEYIAVYVDDIAIAAKDPESIIECLKNVHLLQLKGVGLMKFHLGCDFFKDPDNTLCFGPKKYIEKMLQNYEHLFKEKPKEYSSPLEKNDHPELDMSEYLNSTNIKIYQSLIGAIQWVVSLGRFDVHTAVMTMSHFRIAPKEGHLSRLKRIYGYLSKFKEGVIRVRIDEPDFSNIPDFEHDWASSVYGDVEELIPADIPEPLGKPVVLTHYVDANLYHDLVTGRAVTGILHLLNQTPIDWYSKRQATVETATYGSEFVAARICTDQVIDLRTTLRYLGVPIKGKSYMFGDNQSVINNATIPHSALKKRHNALSYHRVREAIAAHILTFLKIDGKKNPSDVLSKHCGYIDAWPLIKPLLFWRGDTAYILYNDEVRPKGECQDSNSISPKSDGKLIQESTLKENVD